MTGQWRDPGCIAAGFPGVEPRSHVVHAHFVSALPLSTPHRIAKHGQAWAGSRDLLGFISCLIESGGS